MVFVSDMSYAECSTCGESEAEWLRPECTLVARPVLLPQPEPSPLAVLLFGAEA